MAPGPAKWITGLGGTLLAGFFTAVVSGLTRLRRKRKAPGTASEDVAGTTRVDGPACSSSTEPAARGRPWASTYGASTSAGGEGRERRSGEGQAPGPSSGLLSRVLGRPSESLESAVSCSGDTAGSSTHGCDDYESSEEQDGEFSAESRSGYGKSDRARLVDLWIESALLVSRDVRLDKRHFDRTTRQNLKKMRPASAQLVLSEIADRSWESTGDIAKEVHRLVSHAKAQDKFAIGMAAQPALLYGRGSGGGVGGVLGTSGLVTP